MIPNKLDFEKQYKGPMGISSSCAHCDAPFVDIAYDLSKDENSDEIEVNFVCKICKKQNIVKFNQSKTVWK